ncbi:MULTISPECIES: FtsB family cell division protein [Hyphomicrobiales]|uniref:Cell division protein FtsB n=1 Tax=Rhodopseudomonas julia TaxID=200617 RepID=A0ABU0C9T2_9BRAD|nr:MULTISPECIES: septum formation initiator family protein [Hyphomicrobiales]MCF1502741.1 septum formation initiator family protein [Afifella sp. H1R]MDQ0327283.1 cell division protein FtsB [Rhodopseudomonas julia]
MATRQRKQSKLKPLALPLGCLLVLAYFSYHAVEGHYGLEALETLEARKVDLNKELDELLAKRAKLERRVALLRPDSLDRDMLDERARQALNLVHPTDIVIYDAADGS